LKQFVLFYCSGPICEKSAIKYKLSASLYSATFRSVIYRDHLRLLHLTLSVYYFFVYVRAPKDLYGFWAVSQLCEVIDWFCCD